MLLSFPALRLRDAGRRAINSPKIVSILNSDLDRNFSNPTHIFDTQKQTESLHRPLEFLRLRYSITFGDANPLQISLFRSPICAPGLQEGHLLSRCRPIPWAWKLYRMLLDGFRNRSIQTRRYGQPEYRQQGHAGGNQRD